MIKSPFASHSRAGLLKPSLPVTVVDISRLLESRDSESPARNQSVSSTATTRSYATAPTAYGVGVSNATPNTLAGGPVGPPPPQLPPVSSFQTGPLQPLPSMQQHYLPGPEPHYDPRDLRNQYYSTQPSLSVASALPSYTNPPFANLPPISTPIPGPSQHLPVSSIPAKRGAAFPPSAESPGPPEKKGKWTPEEDKLAIELRRGGMKWDDIAKRLPGRSAISCRLRYQNYSEKRQDWDDEKKNKLARLYNRFVRPFPPQALPRNGVQSEERINSGETS